MSGELRGDCRNYSCGKSFKLRADGNVPKHETLVERSTLDDRMKHVGCWGSDEPPYGVDKVKKRSASRACK